jgi:hypothetical protein
MAGQSSQKKIEKEVVEKRANL